MRRICVGVMAGINENHFQDVLVLRCQMGDQSAFERLIELYQAPLVCFVGTLLGRPQEAEDVVQSVWLVVLRKICTLRDPRVLNVWLYQIARRRVYLDLRRTRRFVALEEAEDQITPTQDGSIEVEKDEEIEKLYSCLQKIKPEYREVLMLQFLEGMSIEQISGVTQCKAGTVKSRVFYAKLALKHEMERKS